MNKGPLHSGFTYYILLLNFESFCQVDLFAGTEEWVKAPHTMRHFAQAPQHGLGYRAMCRFFAGAVMNLEILRQEFLKTLKTPLGSGFT